MSNGSRLKNPWAEFSQVNPQRENGHREINTEDYLALMKLPWTAAERKIIDAVIHKTWGYGKYDDTISVTQFREMTGLSARAIRENIKLLKDRRIIYYEPSDEILVRGSPLNCFLFNKHYDTWDWQGCAPPQGCAVAQGCAVTSLTPAPRRHSPLRRGAATKEKYTKEKYTKEKDSPPPPKEEEDVYPPDFLNFYSSHLPFKALGEEKAFQVWNRFPLDFLKFYYSGYPNRVRREKAFRAWTAAKKKKILPPIEEILLKIEQQKKSEAWTKEGGRFIPHPATWLKAGGWDDELPEKPLTRGQKAEKEAFERLHRKNPMGGQPGGS